MAKERQSGGFLEMLGGARARAPHGAAVPREVGSAVPKEQRPELEDKVLARIEPKQEGLVEHVLARREVPAPEEAKSDLEALHGALAALSQKTVVVIFAMGKVLATVKEQLPHGEFIPWVEGNCSFNVRSAQRYLQVYERYKDEPRRALAELSISEAYIEAGVKKLAAPEQEGDEIHSKGKPDLAAGIPQASEYRRIFDQATMSGVQLKHHRVFPYRDGSLFVVRPELGPQKVCELYVDMSIKDLEYQDAIQEVHHNLQMALEVFYSKMEACESKGIIGTPFDSSRPAMARKMRNVSPEKGKPAKPAPRSKGGKKK